MLLNISNDGPGTSIEAKTIGQLTLAAVVVIGGCMGVGSPPDSPSPSPAVDEETDLESTSTATEGNSTPTGTATPTDTSTPTPTPSPTPTATPTPTPTSTATATPTDEEDEEYNATQEFLDNLDEAGIEVTEFVDEHEDLEDGEWAMEYESDLPGYSEMDDDTDVWAIFAEEAKLITRAYCNAIVTHDGSGFEVHGESVKVYTGTYTTFEVDARDCRSMKQGTLDWGETDLMSFVFGSMELESGAEDFPY